MYNSSSSSPTQTNVTFSGNTANGGGGMHNDESSPTLTNVTFSGNDAITGGGMRNDESSPTIANTILWGNTAGVSGPQIDNYTSFPSIQYSDVQGGCASILVNDCSGGGNIDADPLFVRNPSPGADVTWGTPDDDYGDLRLQLTSPAIDAGDIAAVPFGVTTDLLGYPRFVDIASVPDTGSGTPPIVDIGAYEAQILVVYLPLTMK